jgi:excinuclease ABC A subunit
VEERLTASYFSYNAPNGMCLKCAGRGAYFEIDLSKLVPSEHTTLQEVFDTVGISPGYARLLERRFNDYLAMPFSQIPDEVRQEILYGHHVSSNYERRSYSLARIFQGRLYKSTQDLSGVYVLSACSECHGFRIGAEARRVRLNGKHIGELGKLTLSELQAFLEALLEQPTTTAFGKKWIKEILSKIRLLIKSRLGHLSLYRELPTLSGGEVQRLFLSSHLESQLDSLIYILDEPTVGLHESEKAELSKAIRGLKELGNTVIVVEHDRNTIGMADYIIDIGPKAGSEGGQVVYQGDLAGLLQCEESITGQYLSGKATMPGRTTTRMAIVPGRPAPGLTIRHARTHNLKDVSVSLPLGGLVGIAGVSGSGKSALISDTLMPLLIRNFREQWEHERTVSGENEGVGDDASAVMETVADQLEGVEHIAGFAEVSQAPIGRNVNSNPATYIGIWDKIRRLFAKQPEATQRNLSAGHFSFNSQGACSVCGGSGLEKIWLGGDNFIYHACRECHGKRYNAEALSVRYKGKTIVDVLETSISDAVDIFEEYPAITTTLIVMDRIGMGYITLGQPTPSLSGGEAQRIKLAKEIGRRRKGNILYVLDEPTTGLSLYDTAQLIQLMDELVAKGNSVIVVEHDLDVLAACDWIVELGPGGGAAGGRVIAEGLPQALKDHPQSATGKFLP